LIWIPAFAGMTAFVDFASAKAVFIMRRSFRSFSKTAVLCHSRVGGNPNTTAFASCVFHKGSNEMPKTYAFQQTLRKEEE
jgi:hypothetical protein